MADEGDKKSNVKEPPDGEQWSKPEVEEDEDDEEYDKDDFVPAGT